MVDFGDDVRSTVTGVTARSAVTTRTERTSATRVTSKSKKHKDVCPFLLTRYVPFSCDARQVLAVEVDGRIKFILLGMIFFLLKSSVCWIVD